MARLPCLLVLVLCCSLGQATLRPYFEPRNRPTFRGIRGELVEMPCTIHNANTATVRWMRGSEQLSHNYITTSQDPRHRLRRDYSSNTWMMLISGVEAADEGEYQCEVETPAGEVLTKTFTLTLVEPEAATWRADQRCGRSNLFGALSHVRAQCDGQGTYPCCSTFGWCGFGASHCDCDDCVDYSKLAPRVCPYPFSHITNTSLCYEVGPELVDYDGAVSFCEALGASLLDFDSLEDITEDTRHEIFNAGLTPLWLEPSADGDAMNFLFSLFGGSDHTTLEMEACAALVGSETSDVDCSLLHLPLCIKHLN